MESLQKKTESFKVTESKRLKKLLHFLRKISKGKLARIIVQRLHTIIRHKWSTSAQVGQKNMYIDISYNSQSVSKGFLVLD